MSRNNNEDKDNKDVSVSNEYEFTQEEAMLMYAESHPQYETNPW